MFSFTGTISVLFILTFFDLPIVRWPIKPVQYNLNLEVCDSLGAIDAEIKEVIAATECWSNIGDMTIERVDGAHGRFCTPTGHRVDGRNIIVIDKLFGDSDLNKIAECEVMYDSISGLIYDADIIINRDYIRLFRNHAYSLKQVLIHEFGHLLGLWDLNINNDPKAYHNPDTTSIMRWYYSSNRGLIQSDRDSLLVRYPKKKP